MSPPDLMPSMNKPGSSSAGTSLTTFIAPCDRAPFHWTGTDPHGPQRYVFPLLGSEAGTYSVCLDLWLDCPPEYTEFAHDDWDRLACLLLISRLKARGLGEAVQSLRDMVEFYAEEPPPRFRPHPQSRCGRRSAAATCRRYRLSLRSSRCQIA